jgi:hypothetical protein
MKHLFRFFFIMTFLFPVYTYAELSATLTLTPENPGPYQKTNITLVSYSFDVDTSYITWTINGKQVRAGLGEKILTATTGAVGQTSAIRVRATLKDGSGVDLDLNLTPQGVDIMWESPESYVPPFYEGRSLPGEGATVRVVALPSMSYKGVATDPSQVAYSWFVNNQFMAASSGAGKQSANLRLDYLSDSSVIRVLARDVNGNTATKEITIIPHSAVPLFYLTDPAYGIDYSQNLGLRYETTGDVTLAFVPYFFSNNGTLSTTTSYTWTLNGSPITPTSNSTLTLSPEKNTTGYHTLSVSVENTKRTLQKALGSLTIVFDTR